MPYAQVQFIGHAITTGPRYVSQPKAGFEYAGLPDDAQDIQKRLQFVSSVLDKTRARADVVKSENDTLLKVFVMPEFLFRGRNGAYPVSQQGTDLVTEGLRRIVSDARWNDWLFCFGSIIGTAAPAQKGLPNEIYNYVPFFVGGDVGKGSAQQLRVVMKEHLSRIDFVWRAPPPDLPQAVPGLAGLVREDVEHLQALGPTRSEVQQRPEDGTSVFDAGGFTWGLEVCLDHAKKRLRNSQNLPRLDFQLIPSCGMSIDPQATALRDGWVFNVDGLNNGKNGAKAAARGSAHTALCEVKAGVLGQPRDPLVRIALTDDVSTLYSNGPGEVHVYAPVPGPLRKS